MSRWMSPSAVVLSVALGVRVLAALFSEDLWGDAPVRLELVGRWVKAPGLWWSYAEVFQFGPLPTHLAGLLSMVFGPHWGPRLLVMTGGVLSVWLAMRVGRRLGGESVGVAAGLALALSPLHLQSSVTFSTEALYTAFALALLDRLLARDAQGIALWAFAASTTRWDAWLWLPLVALFWLFQAPVGARRRAFLQACLFALGPLSILAANALNGDAMAPLRHVSDEHVMLASQAEGEWGTTAWRLAMLFWWPMALLIVLTPGFGLWTLYSLVSRIREGLGRLSREEGLVLATGALAPVLYAVRAVLFGSFWPMARFAVGPAAFLMLLMRPLSKKELVVCTAVALLFNLGLLLFAGDEGFGPRLSALSPVPRLPAELRLAVEHLQQNGCENVRLERGPAYEEIPVALHSGCDRFELERRDRAGSVVTFAAGEDEPGCRLSRQLGRMRIWNCD